MSTAALANGLVSEADTRVPLSKSLEMPTFPAEVTCTKSCGESLLVFKSFCHDALSSFAAAIADNLVLTSYHRAPYARGILRNDAAIRKMADERIQAFDVRTNSAENKASTLSGGNQQKVVVAREFDRDLRLLVLDQPTRGLDVGSI